MLLVNIVAVGSVIVFCAHTNLKLRMMNWFYSTHSLVFEQCITIVKKYSGARLVMFLFLTHVILISGCFSTAYRSKEQILSSVPWSPANLENISCPDISGKYKGEQILMALFDLRSSLFNNLNNSFLNYKEIPYQSVVKKREALRGQKISPEESTYVYSDSTQFYSESFTEIEQNGDTLKISLVDKENTIYKKFTLNLVPPYIGCSENSLVIRVANAIGSAEGALGTANAAEKIFRKLPDGSLEVRIKIREWYYSSFSGLVGIGPDNHARGTEPRKNDSVFVFPSDK